MLDHISTLLLLVTCILQNVSAHEVKMGSCPKVDVVRDFDYSKMSGLWYVIQKTQSASTCMTLDFKNSHGKLTVAETCLPMGIKVPFVMEKFTQVGKLKVPDEQNAAKMRLAYPYSIIPFTEVDFWIIETDYTTYAATWSCRPIAFINRQSGMILSRNTILDNEIVHRLREKFASYNINKNALSIVKQKGCTRNEVLNPKDLYSENNNPENEPNQDTVTITATEKETTTHTQTHLATETVTELPTTLTSIQIVTTTERETMTHTHSATQTVTAAPTTHTTVHTVTEAPTTHTTIQTVTEAPTTHTTVHTVTTTPELTTVVVTPEPTVIFTPKLTTVIVTPEFTSVTPEFTSVTPEFTSVTPKFTTVTPEYTTGTTGIQPTTPVKHRVEPTVTRLPDDPHNSQGGVNEITDV